MDHSQVLNQIINAAAPQLQFCESIKLVNPTQFVSLKTVRENGKQSAAQR